MTFGDNLGRIVQANLLNEETSAEYGNLRSRILKG
jgi:hypothetical protein